MGACGVVATRQSELGEEDITHVDVLYKLKWGKEGSENEKAVSCMHPIKDGVVDGW